jgi:hypothetical protein
MKIVTVFFINKSADTLHRYQFSATLKPGQSGKVITRVPRDSPGVDTDVGAGTISSCYVNGIEFDDGTYIQGPVPM